MTKTHGPRALFAVALGASLSVFAQAKGAGDAAALGPRSAIDWADRVVRATAKGAPDMAASSPAQARLGAESAAKRHALSNLLSQVKSARLWGDVTVGDAMNQGETQSRVEGAVRSYEVVNKRFFSDQGVQIEVKLPLSALSAVLAPPAAPGRAPSARPGGSKHTGLVVDARELKAQPALWLRLFDEDGRVLSSGAPAHYFSSPDEAQKSRVAGARPLWVKAQSARGSDIILSKAAASELSDMNPRSLAEGHLAVLLGEGI